MSNKVPEIGEQVYDGHCVGKITQLVPRIIVSGIYYDYVNDDRVYKEPWRVEYQELTKWDIYNEWWNTES